MTTGEGLVGVASGCGLMVVVGGFSGWEFKQSLQ